MNPTYRNLIKHSAIYGLGQVLSRLASVVMLPVHTRYLTPADYGTIAILDLTITVFAIVLGAGLTPALARYHQEATSPEAEATVWWTGLTVVAAMTTVAVVAGILLRDALSVVLLGPVEGSGGLFVAIALATLWFGVLTQISLVYFRLRMWSWLNVGLSLATLFFNVGLNLYFLVEQQWGVAAVLIGNLITLGLSWAIRFAIVARSCGRFRFDRRLSRQMLRFGAPIAVTSILAAGMSQADRYMLRLFVDLDTVGLYTLAYQIGQGLIALFVLPFTAVWGVTMYDVARQPDAKEMYARVFEYYVYAVLLLLLAVALFARPLLEIFATQAYLPAASLVPILCLALLFFSLDDHIRVPALLAKRTMSLVPANAIALGVSVGLNLLLLPRFGVVAAAWTSVVTYAIFAGVNLFQARRIDRYDYPLGRCAMVLAAMIVTFVMTQGLVAGHDGMGWTLGVPLIVWGAWAAGLAYPAARHFVRRPALPAEV